jgi:hypothetical protein
MRPLSEEAATAVYNLLVEVAEAPKVYASHFIYHFTSERPPDEWRFQGILGFGGKFYRDRRAWRVRCYREDYTPEREKIIVLLNEKLAELRAQYEEDTWTTNSSANTSPVS